MRQDSVTKLVTGKKVYTVLALTLLRPEFLAS